MSPSATRSAVAYGLTLIELMVVIALLAVVLAIATPSFAALLRQWRLTATVEALTGDLRLARSTSIRTSRPAALCMRNGDQCGTGSDWRGGWLVFSDLNNDGDLDTGEPLIAQRGPQAGIASITSPKAVRFRGNGTLNEAMAGINIEPTGAEASEPGWEINLTAMGRLGVKAMKAKASDKEKK